MNKIDELLETNCYIIDFLPEQVKPDTKGQFFDVENYFLNSKRSFSLKDRFVNVILKLMYYYHVSIHWGGWTYRPMPQLVAETVDTIWDNHSGWLNVLLPDENSLVVFEGDSLNLSVHNPSEEIQAIVEKIAFSEGLFWWKSEVNRL